MKICVIGGGNIGTAISACFSKNHHDVTIYTPRCAEFCGKLEAIDFESETLFSTQITATDDLCAAASVADMICITYPSFMIKDIFENLCNLLKPDAIVGVIPGTGGVEFFKNILGDHTIFGLDRVPFIARIKEYGKSVYYSKKKSVRIAALPGEKTSRICDVFGNALGIECMPLKNYLTVTFTPSNPIVHTARTYAMFKDYKVGIFYSRIFLFYKEWDDRASKLLLGMDDELQQVCGALSRHIDLSGVIPLYEHYESQTVEQLTTKIKNIATLTKITSPMKEIEDGFVPDFNSRYFIEDIPYGLTILKGFSEIVGVKTPNMDKVLRWNGEKLGEKYIDDNGKILPESNSITPQKFGVNTVQDIYNLYCGEIANDKR